MLVNYRIDSVAIHPVSPALSSESSSNGRLAVARERIISGRDHSGEVSEPIQRTGRGLYPSRRPADRCPRKCQHGQPSRMTAGVLERCQARDDRLGGRGTCAPEAYFVQSTVPYPPGLRTVAMRPPPNDIVERPSRVRIAICPP